MFFKYLAEDNKGDDNDNDPFKELTSCHILSFHLSTTPT